MSEMASAGDLDEEAEALEKINQYVAAINNTKAPEGAKSKFEARTTAVLDGWAYLINLLESKTVKNFPLVFDMMYLATAKIILSGDWYTARMENNYKNGDKLKGDLLAALQAIKLKAPDDFATEQKCCILLEPLVEVEPWNNVDYMSDILKNDVTDPKVTLAATKLLEKETIKLVDVRLEALCTQKIYECAFKLGEALYINPYWETEKTDPFQMTEHERSREDLTDFFYLLICSRSKSDEGARLMKKHLTIPTAVKVVHRISQNPSAKRIAGRWKEWKKAYKTILNATIKFFLNSKGQEIDPSAVRSLFHEWVKSSDPTDTGEIRPFTDMLNQINQVPIDFVYALADVLYDDFKSLPNAIPNAIELYFRAMSLDINHIAKVEVAESEAQENSEQTTARKESENLKQKLQRNLAQRYLRLAQVFSHDTKQAWELTLTAFSLSPSDELLQKLFHSSDFDSPQGEGFPLPEALQQDLLSLATNPRRKNLCWEKDREKLQKLCKDHLDTGGPKIKGKKDLVNLEIDYETYKPDRRPDAEDDTGFERGYEPHYIKRLLPKLTRRRAIVRKNVIKKPGVVAKRGRPKAAAGLHLKSYNFQRSQQASKVREGSFDRPKVIYPWKIPARSLIPIARYKHKMYKMSRLKPRIIRLGSFLQSPPPPVGTEPEGQGSDPPGQGRDAQSQANGPQRQVKGGPDVPRISVFDAVYLNQLTLMSLEDLNDPSFNEKYLQGTLKLNLDDESDPKEPLREFAELIKDEIAPLLPVPTSSPFVKLTPLPEQFATIHAINYGLDIFLQVIQQGFKSLAIAAEDTNRSETVQKTPNRSILEVPKGEISQVIAEVCATEHDEESPPVNFTNYVPPPKLHLKPGPKSVREKEKIEFIQNTCENMKQNLRVKTQALGLTFSDGKLLSACPVPVAADSAGSSGRELVPYSPKISSVQVMEYEDMFIAHACASKRHIENMAGEGESDRLALEGPAAGRDEEGRTLEPPAYVREIIKLVFSGSDRSASPTLSTTSSFPEAFTPAELQYISDSPAEAYKSEDSDYLRKRGVGKGRKIKKKAGPKSMKRQKKIKPIEEERPEPPTFDPKLNFPVGRYPLVFPTRPPVEPDETGLENHSKYSKDLMFLNQETGLFDEVNEGVRFESPGPDETCGFQSYDPMAGMKDHQIMEDNFPLIVQDDSAEQVALESDINGDMEVPNELQVEESVKSQGSESDQGPPTKSNKPTEGPQRQGPGPSKKSGTKARSKSAETKRSTSLDRIKSLCNQKCPFVQLERIPLDEIKKKLCGISEKSPGPSVVRRRTRSSTRSSLADSDADSVCSYKSSRSLELKAQLSDSTDSGRRSSTRRKSAPKKAPEDYAVAKAGTSRGKRKNVVSSDEEGTKELVQQKPKRRLSGKKSPKKRGRPKRNKKNYNSEDENSVTSVETVTIDDSESEGPTPGESSAVLEPQESVGEACGVQAAGDDVERGQVAGDLPVPQPQGLIVRGVGGDISAPIIISDESESEALEDPLEVCQRLAGPVASVCGESAHESEEILGELEEILDEPEEILEEREEILDEPGDILDELEEIRDEPEEIEEEIALCFKTYQEGDTEMIELSVSNENSINSETENPTEEFRSEDPNQDFCNFMANEDLIAEVSPVTGFFGNKIPPGRTSGADGSNDRDVIHSDSDDDDGGGGPQANDIRVEEKETGIVNEEGDDELGALSHIACAGVGSSGPQDPQVDELLPPLEHTNSYQPPRSATPEGEVSVCQEGAAEDEVCERIEEIAGDQVMMRQEVCELEEPVSEGVQLETLLTVEEDKEESKDQQQVQSHLDEVQGPLDEVQGPLDEVQGPLDEVQGPLDDVQSPLNEVQSPLNEAQCSLDEVQGPLDDVQSLLIEVQSPLNEVQSPLNEVQTPLNEVQSPLNEVHSPLNEVQGPLDDVQSLLIEVQSPLNEVQSPLNEVQTPLNEVQTPLNEVHSPLNEVQGPLDDVQSLLIEVQSPLNEVHSPLNEVQGPLDDVQSLLIEVQSPLNEVQSPLNEVHSPLNEVQGPLDDVQSPLNEVQSPLHEVQSPLNEVQSPLNEVQSPLDEVQSPLREVQPPLDEVQGPLDQVQSPLDQVQSPVDEVHPPLHDIPVPLDDFPALVDSIQSNDASLPVQVYDDGPAEPAGNFSVCVDLTTEPGEPLDETSKEDQAGSSPTALSSLENVIQVPPSPEAPLKSPEEPEQAEKSLQEPQKAGKLLEEPERTEREPEEPKQANRSPEEPKQSEKTPEDPELTKKPPEELKETEKSPEKLKQTEKSLEEPEQIEKSSEEHTHAKKSSRNYKHTKKSSKRVKVSVPLVPIDFTGNLESSSPSNPPADKPTNPPTKNRRNSPTKNRRNPPTKNRRNPPTKNRRNPPTEKPPTLPKRSLRCNTKPEEIQGPTNLAHHRRRRKTVKPKRSPSPERQDVGFVILPPIAKIPSQPSEMTSQEPLPTGGGSLPTDEVPLPTFEGPLTTDELVKEPVTEASRIAEESLGSENMESEATDVVITGILPRILPDSEVVSYAIAVQEIDLTCYDMDELELAGETAMTMTMSDNVTPVVIEISNELASSEEFNVDQESGQAADEILIQVPQQVVDICDDEILNNDLLVFEPTGSGAEDLHEDAADVNQDSPDVNRDSPDVNRDSPEVNQVTLDLNHEAPGVNQEVLEVNPDAPEVKLDAPEVKLDAPEVNLDAPEVSQVSMDFNQEAPEVNQDAPDLSQSQNNNSELDRKVIKIEEPAGELSHVVNDEDRNEENTIQTHAPVEQATISSQSMFEDLYDFSPYASETEPDNENVNFNNETKADDNSPVPESQALERVDEDPVFQIVQQVQAFERVEEAQAVERVQEAPAFETLQEAPAFETVPVVPAFETVPEAPAFETVPEAPAVETVPEAPAFEAVSETPVFEIVQETQTFEIVQEFQTFETVQEVQAPEIIEESSPGNLEESSELQLSPSIPYAEVESTYESELNDLKIKTEMNPPLEKVQQEEETEPQVHYQVELKNPEQPTEDQQSPSEADAEVRVILDRTVSKRRRRKKALVSPDITVLSSSSKSSRNYTLRGRDGITKPKKYYDESFEVGTTPGGVRVETNKVEPPKTAVELVSTVVEPLRKKRKSVTKISLPLASEPPEESTVSFNVPEAAPVRPKKPRRFPFSTRRKRKKSTSRKQKLKSSSTSNSAVSVAVTSADGHVEENQLESPIENVERSAASVVQFSQPEIISELSPEPPVESVLLPASSPVAPLEIGAVQSDINSPECPETDGVQSDMPPECPPEVLDPAIFQLPLEPFQSLPDMKPAFAICKREIDSGSAFEEWENNPNEIQVVTVKVETIHLPIIPSMVESSSENISKGSTDEARRIPRSPSPGLSRGQSAGLSRAQSPGLPRSLSPIIVSNIPDTKIVLSADETDASIPVQPESQEAAIQVDMIPVQPAADIVAVKTKRARKSRKTASEPKRRKPSTSTPASQLATQRQTLTDSSPPAEKKQEDPALAKTRDFVVEVEPITLPAKRLRRQTPAGLALRSGSGSTAGSAGQSEMKEKDDGPSWPKKRRTRIFQSASSSQNTISQLVEQQPVNISSVPAPVQVEAAGSVRDEEPMVVDVKPVVLIDEKPVVLLEVQEPKTESTVRNRRKRRPRAESSAGKTTSSTSRNAAARKSQIEEDQIIMNSSGGYSSSPPVLSCAEDDNTTDTTFSERDNSPPHLDRQV